MAPLDPAKTPPPRGRVKRAKQPGTRGVAPSERIQRVLNLLVKEQHVPKERIFVHQEAYETLDDALALPTAIAERARQGGVSLADMYSVANFNFTALRQEFLDQHSGSPEQQGLAQGVLEAIQGVNYRLVSGASVETARPAYDAFVTFLEGQAGMGSMVLSNDLTLRQRVQAPEGRTFVDPFARQPRRGATKTKSVTPYPPEQIRRVPPGGTRVQGSITPPREQTEFIYEAEKQPSGSGAELGTIELGERLAPPVEEVPWDSTADVEEGGLTKFGHYVVGDVLGQGQFGVVYKAVHDETGREVALKVLSGVPDEHTKLRFGREAETMGALSEHPNVVTIYDSGIEDERTQWLAMELVPGGKNLEDLIKEQGSLSDTETLELGQGIAAGLAAAHEKKIIHRDIKPENIMLGQDEEGYVEPKIADFGLAKRQGGLNVTKTGTGMGTPSYMPPELLTEAKRAGQRSDVYSLGATLYHMITGTRPFNSKGMTMQQVKGAIIFGDPEPITQRRPELAHRLLAQQLEPVIDKCMSKEAADRYKNAGEVLVELDKIIDGEQPTAPPVSQGVLAKRWVRKHRWGVGGIAAAAALMIALPTGYAINKAGQLQDRISGTEARIARALKGDDYHVAWAQAEELAELDRQAGNTPRLHLYREKLFHAQMGDVDDVFASRGYAGALQHLDDTQGFATTVEERKKLKQKKRTLTTRHVQGLVEDARDQAQEHGQNAGRTLLEATLEKDGLSRHALARTARYDFAMKEARTLISTAREKTRQEGEGPDQDHYTGIQTLLNLADNIADGKKVKHSKDFNRLQREVQGKGRIEISGTANAKGQALETDVYLLPINESYGGERGLWRADEWTVLQNNGDGSARLMHGTVTDGVITNMHGNDVARQGGEDFTLSDDFTTLRDGAVQYRGQSIPQGELIILHQRPGTETEITSGQHVGTVGRRGLTLEKERGNYHAFFVPQRGDEEVALVNINLKRNGDVRVAETAEGKALRLFTSEDIGQNNVYITPGPFEKTKTGYEGETGFFMGRTETTVAQYDNFATSMESRFPDAESRRTAIKSLKRKLDFTLENGNITVDHNTIASHWQDAQSRRELLHQARTQLNKKDLVTMLGGLTKEWRWNLPGKTGYLGSKLADNATDPLRGISHDKATAYMAAMNGRVPTHKEWQKAAGNFDGRTYTWGEQEPTAKNQLASFIETNADPTSNYFAPTRRDQDTSPSGLRKVASGVREFVLAITRFNGRNVDLTDGGYYGSPRKDLAVNASNPDDLEDGMVTVGTRQLTDLPSTTPSPALGYRGQD